MNTPVSISIAGYFIDQLVTSHDLPGPRYGSGAIMAPDRVTGVVTQVGLDEVQWWVTVQFTSLVAPCLEIFVQCWRSNGDDVTLDRCRGHLLFWEPPVLLTCPPCEVKRTGQPDSIREGIIQIYYSVIGTKSFKLRYSWYTLRECGPNLWSAARGGWICHMCYETMNSLSLWINHIVPSEICKSER